MAAHDSKYPGEAKARTIRVDGSGVSMNWRNIVIGVLTVIGGIGGYTGFSFVTVGQLDARMADEQKARKDGDAAIQKEVVGLTVRVASVQQVQQMDISYREARRVVGEQFDCRGDDEGCLQRKELELERIRRLNMARLQADKPEPPCSDLSCR